MILLFKRLFCLIFILLFISISFFPAAGEEELPLPDENGNYCGGTTHRHWIVVDKDFNGLNGRLADNFPKDWEDPRSLWPGGNIGQWPVVHRFYPGSILNACMGNRGIIFLNDDNGNPWIMISVSMDEVCFVRANSKYIKPVRVLEN